MRTWLQTASPKMQPPLTKTSANTKSSAGFENLSSNSVQTIHSAAQRGCEEEDPAFHCGDEGGESRVSASWHINVIGCF